MGCCDPLHLDGLDPLELFLHKHFLLFSLLLLLFLQLFETYFGLLVLIDLMVDPLLLLCIFKILSPLHLIGQHTFNDILLVKLLLHQGSVLAHGRLRSEAGADRELREQFLLLSELSLIIKG